MTEPMDPHKTILVLKYKGREIGRIPATAPNASEYVQELSLFYGKKVDPVTGNTSPVTVDYEPDTTGGLLAMMHQKR